ncbi:hypothetical protein AVEN_36616-1, partial [Araneus ventricosus]
NLADLQCKSAANLLRTKIAIWVQERFDILENVLNRRGNPAAMLRESARTALARLCMSAPWMHHHNCYLNWPGHWKETLMRFSESTALRIIAENCDRIDPSRSEVHLETCFTTTDELINKKTMQLPIGPQI